MNKTLTDVGNIPLKLMLTDADQDLISLVQGVLLLRAEFIARDERQEITKEPTFAIGACEDILRHAGFELSVNEDGKTVFNYTPYSVRQEEMVRKLEEACRAGVFGNDVEFEEAK